MSGDHAEVPPVGPLAVEPTAETPNVFALLKDAYDRQARSFDAFKDEFVAFRGDLKKGILVIAGALLVSQLLNVALVAGTIYVNYKGVTLGVTNDPPVVPVPVPVAVPVPVPVPAVVPAPATATP